ncbi:MAG: hypothetical protein GY754_08555 [bacterium]|nr:hypothetical protein [bacterium]
MRMIYNWGKLCQRKEIETPILNQSLFPEPEKLNKKETKQKALSLGWKKLSIITFVIRFSLLKGVLFNRTNGFYFSSSSLDGLKDELLKSTGYPVSTNVAISALLTYLSIKLHYHKSNSSITAAIVLDMRERHENFTGTFIGNASTVIASKEFSSNSGLNDIAKYIFEAIEPFRRKPSEHLKEFLSLTLNTVHYNIPFYVFNITNMLTKKPTAIYINNFSRFHIYDANFGYGKPICVLPHDLYDPVLIWPAHPSKGGLEVYFAGRNYARINKMKKDDPWLNELERYSIDKC